MKKIIALLLVTILCMTLVSCGSKADKDTESNQPGSAETAQEIGSGASDSTEDSADETSVNAEAEPWMPEATGKYADGKILYDQINWGEFEPKNDDIMFFGLPGSQWNWDTLEQYSEGITVMAGSGLMGENVSFDDIQNCEAFLQNTVAEEGHKSSYDYSLSLNSSHSPDMYVFGFKPADVKWNVEINFPTHDHDVKVCDAYSNMGFCLTAHSLKDEFNIRTEFALEALGDEFYNLICPLDTNIKNSFAGEYIELLMQKLGKPTGVIEKVRAEFFNNYQWFMYWERDGYVICIKIDERESGDNWSSEFSEPKLITQSAWDFVKEETLTNDDEYEFNDIRF